MKQSAAAFPEAVTSFLALDKRGQINAFEQWVKRMPPEEKYTYSSIVRCPLAQFGNSLLGNPPRSSDEPSSHDEWRKLSFYATAGVCHITFRDRIRDLTTVQSFRFEDILDALVESGDFGTLAFRLARVLERPLLGEPACGYNGEAELARALLACGREAALLGAPIETIETP
jgi:hypothetical protein